MTDAEIQRLAALCEIVDHLEMRGNRYPDALAKATEDRDALLLDYATAPEPEKPQPTQKARRTK